MRPPRHLTYMYDAPHLLCGARGGMVALLSLRGTACCDGQFKVQAIDPHFFTDKMTPYKSDAEVRNEELAGEFKRADELMYTAMHDTETLDMMLKRCAAQISKLCPLHCC